MEGSELFGTVVGSLLLIVFTTAKVIDRYWPKNGDGHTAKKLGEIVSGQVKMMDCLKEIKMGLEYLSKDLARVAKTVDKIEDRE